MAMYVKKLIVVDAFQLDPRGENAEWWFKKAVEDGKIITYNFGDNFIEDAWCVINTSEGNLFANAGDYIINGVSGNITVCSPEEFEMEYEIIKDWK